MLNKLAEYAKAIVALAIPIAVEAVVQLADVLQGSDDQVLRLVGLAVVTAIGVYAVPNRKQPAGLPNDVTAP